MNFILVGKQGGLCAQEVGTWAWIHHVQVPWGDIGMISQSEKPWGGGSQPEGFPGISHQILFPNFD